MLIKKTECVLRRLSRLVAQVIMRSPHHAKGKEVRRRAAELATSPTTTTRRQRAGNLLRAGSAGVEFSMAHSVGVEPVGALFSSVGDGVIVAEQEARRIANLAILVYEKANKRRRRRADLWLGRGAILQALRFLLDVDGIVKASVSTASDTSTFDEDAHEQLDYRAASAGIKEVTLADVAAALGLSNPTHPTLGLSLIQKRELNLKILNMTRILINREGDSTIQLGQSLAKRQSSKMRRKRRADDVEFKLKATSQQILARHSRAARNLGDAPLTRDEVVCFECRLGTDACLMAQRACKPKASQESQSTM